MPSIKARQRMIAQNFISSSGLYKEIFIPWQNVFFTASGVANMGASLLVKQSGSGIFGLQYNSTSSGCFVGVSFRAPQDIAITGPAAGSGQLLADWTDISANSTVTTFAACVIYTPSGSEYAATSTSQVLGSGCVAATGGSANQNNSSSIANFNFPTNRTGLFTVRFGVMHQDASDTTQANFVLYGLRLRYLADRIGS